MSSRVISHSTALTAGFELIETAITGGSATVYKTRHLSTGNLCALKLPVSDTTTSALEREAKLLAQLNHPSIVRPFESGFIESTPYLATHWVDGERLSELLRQDTQFGEDRAIHLLSQIASALQHAHDKGVVHADISPANIIIDINDHATIIDFGIGRQNTLATLSTNSNFTGTLRYVAPEVIQGAKATAASDQYSVAVILYELLTGSWPYEDNATAAAALHSHLYAQPVNAQERNPMLSSAMDHMLSKSLNKDPDARFYCIADMVSALTDKTHGINRPVTKTTVPTEQVKSTLMLKSMGKSAAVVAAALTLTTGVWFQHFYTSRLASPTMISESHAHEFNSQCNLLAVPEFNQNGLVENFYGSDGLPERISLFAIDKDQWRMEIGKPNEYGLYGQIVNVQSGLEYQLSATVERHGYVHMPALRIEWLDKEYQVMPDLMTEFSIAALQDGLITMPSVKVPNNAAYAVPTVYKDKTAGTMAISSMFFRELGCL